MTVAFAAVITMALLALVTVTLQLDDEARLRDAHADLQRYDLDLRNTISVGSSGLQLGAFEQAVQQASPPRWGVLSAGTILAAGPDQSALPGDSELARIARGTTVDGGPRTFSADDIRGRPVLWTVSAVLPDPGHDPPPGSVVMIGEPVPRAAAHARLQGALYAAVALLVALAAGLGHLIAGWAMRPAVRGLDQQEQFLTEAAHELRTPLATLRLIADDPDGDSRGVRMRRQIERLERLTESLLLRARLDTGGLELERTPLRFDQLVEHVSDEVVGQRAQVLTEPTVIDGDPTVLELAVRNLVENAVRHGDGRPQIHLAEGELRVVDHGPGIRPRNRRAMLQPGISGAKGTGRGLALVLWAVRAHGGELELTATEGGGLTVIVRLPPAASRSSSTPHRPSTTVKA
ncbi:sensor histidine kinase [Amnibacterium kyonggiense]